MEGRRRHGRPRRTPAARGRDDGPSRGRRPRDDDAPAPRTHVVGLVERAGRLLQVAPFFEPGPRLTVGKHRDARPGRIVLVRTRAAARGGHARIERVLGDPANARDVIEALMLHRGLARRFPAGVARAAEEARDEVLQAGADPAGGHRVDLTSLPTFTIDPVTAKDFDDAISAEELEDGRIRVWVHIADVTAFVRPATALDRVAFERGTSVYVPGAVEPMIPPALSNEACSLVPGADRLAVTVEMDFDGHDVVRTAFHRSRVRSDARLDYDRVDRILAGSERAEEPWAGPLDLARRVAAALDERRLRRGRALTLESEEPEFTFDAAGHVESVRPTEQTEAHRLIEHLMIAANEQVARLLVERRVPTLYRVHEPPEPPSVERLLDQLDSLDVPTPPMPPRMTATQAADVVADASRLVDAHVRRTGHGRRGLTSLVLRSLQQARYAPEPLGHAGLGSEHYCHFTSPIRRAPDIVCHRALLGALGAGEEPPRRHALDELGAWTSARERDAASIERTADDVARAFLLERRIFEDGGMREFDGEIVGLIEAGAFVAFGDDFEGMLAVRRLRDDWYELSEQGTVLRGGEGALRLGDPVRVFVRRVETARGRVDLDLA